MHKLDVHVGNSGSDFILFIAYYPFCEFYLKNVT
jgi:hypothetical protein